MHQKKIGKRSMNGKQWGEGLLKETVEQFICVLVIMLLLFPVKPLKAAAQQISPVVPQQTFSVTRTQSDYIMRTIKPMQINELNNIGKMLASTGSFSAVNERWTRLVESLVIGGQPVDIWALVQWVLRAAYLESSHLLKIYAEKVSYFNELKKELREELNRAKNQLYYWRTSSTFEARFSESLSTRSTAPILITSKEQLKSYIDFLEEKLATLDEDAQLANIDLQNMLQKQQQTLHFMSQISKMLHDTAMAVIRKIG